MVMHVVLQCRNHKLGSLAAQLVKKPPAMRETQIQSLGWDDPLEKERLPTPVFWPGEFHGLYNPWGCKESDTTEQLLLSLSFWNYLHTWFLLKYSWFAMWC